MVADDGPRETMRRNMKYERIAPTIIYSKVQEAISSFLASPTRDRGIIGQTRQLLEDEREATPNPTKRDNATYALRSLDAFENSLNALPLAGLQLQRPPKYRPHIIEGVKISIQPTALVTAVRMRGRNLRGAILVDSAKGTEAKTEEAKAQATAAMTHSAYLLNEHVADAVATEDEKVSPEHCMVFHTYRQQLVTSPTNYRRLLRNLHAACRDIAARWAQIDPPASFDPAVTRYRD